MATIAGQGNSAGIAGAEKATGAEGNQATKNSNQSPRVRRPLPLPEPLRNPRQLHYSVPYELEDAISPPALPKRNKSSPPHRQPEPVRYLTDCLSPVPEVLRLPDPISDLSSSEPSSAHSGYWDYYRNSRTAALLEGVTAYLNFFGPKKPRYYCPTDEEIMATPQLLFVDGTFAELAQELADFIQIGDQVRPLLAQEQNDEALEAIVKASHALNSAPEKDFTGAYNLLIHLVLQSDDPKKYLPTVCGNLLKPITSSPAHGFTLAANALSTIFNLLQPSNPLRYNVFLQIVRFIRQHSQFEVLKPRLKNLDGWFAAWKSDEEDKRKLYVEVSDTAAESGDEDEAYHYLLKAIGTFDREDQDDLSSEEAQKLSLKAIRMALLSPTRFDFQDLRALPAVQALGDSQPIYSQLLDIFTEQDLEDYNDFNEEHKGWLEKEGLDHEKLQRKMRLLTFASLAASTPNREIPYAKIAERLQIPIEEIEHWTIDVIRAKLVEGRLSQQQKVFLVHRTTYRVFGEKQWRELGTRVDQWKSVVDRLLTVVRKAQADVEAQREREQQELEKKLANANISGGHGGRHKGGKQQQQRTDEDD